MCGAGCSPGSPWFILLTEPFKQPGVGLGLWRRKKRLAHPRGTIPQPGNPCTSAGSCCWQLLSMAGEHELGSEDKHGLVKGLIAFPQLPEEC